MYRCNGGDSSNFICVCGLHVSLFSHFYCLLMDACWYGNLFDDLLFVVVFIKCFYFKLHRFIDGPCLFVIKLKRFTQNAHIFIVSFSSGYVFVMWNNFLILLHNSTVTKDWNSANHKTTDSWFFIAAALFWSFVPKIFPKSRILFGSILPMCRGLQLQYQSKKTSSFKSISKVFLLSIANQAVT